MSIRTELELVSNEYGILRPENIVDFAKDPKTLLHGRFEWNNGEAAHQYRLWQARQLIRTVVTVTDDKEKSYSVYVSLKGDRYNEGGGYRTMVSVMNDEELRTALLQEAFEEFKCFREKYGRLRELATIFQTMRKVEKKHGNRH